MTEEDLDKIAFAKQLNLVPVILLENENKSPEVLENHVFISSKSYTDLFVKNNSIETGYENFYLEKDNVKLYPANDFDFIDKYVVCQNCYEQFDSRLSYIAHVGTEICVKTCNGPNRVYLKSKKRRKCRQVRKKNKKKTIENLHSHDSKKNLLNHEILNTLQTRNKCYSDNVESSPKKRGNNFKNDSDPPIKKPRGRPKKDKVVTVLNEPRKRGRPKKINTQTKGFPNNISLNNNLENDETVFRNPLLISSDTNLSNISIKGGWKETLSSGMKNVTEMFWKVFNTDWKHDDREGNEKSFEVHDQIESNKEEKKKDSSVIKNVYLNLEGLKNDLKLLREQLLQSKNNCYKNELESMLLKLEKKHSEFKQNELKKTDTHNNPTTDNRKENIVHCLIKNINNETQVNVNEIINDDEKCIGRWLNEDIEDNVSPAISILMNDGCEPIETIEYVNKDFKEDLTIEYVNDEHFEEDMTIEYLNVDDLTRKGSFEDLGTLTEDINQSSSSSVHSHLNNDDLNYIYNPILGCKICGSFFVSIAEWKLHRSEHIALLENKKCLCKICGLKFKMYKNYINHINTHSKLKQGNPDKKDVKQISTHSKIKQKSQDNYKPLKKYTCKVCSKQYNCIGSYYTHTKIHQNS